MPFGTSLPVRPIRLRPSPDLAGFGRDAIWPALLAKHESWQKIFHSVPHGELNAGEPYCQPA